MTGKPRGLRLPDPLESEIAEQAVAYGQSWSATAQELLTEAIQARKAPGIVFADGPAGRRAVVAGTGLDVWEVIATWQAEQRDAAALRESYPHLSELQLRAALSYYELYPADIDHRLELEEQWTAERVRRELPFARPASAS
jgi:uncharacterized protein (DUF433 family)